MCSVRSSLLVVPVLLLPACTSSQPWRAPAELIALYDQAAPDGLIEIELERDGTLLEVEAEVPISDLPAAAVEEAQRQFPGARFTGAEREVIGGRWMWELQFVHKGRAMELVLDDTGRIFETERELDPSEAPQVVLGAAASAIPGSTFRGIEILETGGEPVYHVKSERGGARYKVVLSPSGEVLRKVREARAELEIPLRD